MTDEAAISNREELAIFGAGKATVRDVVRLVTAGVSQLHERTGHALVEEESQRHGRFGGRPRRGRARA